MNTSFQRTSASDEWYTPKWLIDALGEFDLDPCAPQTPLWKTANRMVDKDEDGLSFDWGGVRTWCNPPYSQPLLSQFCRRMADNGNGILLVFARTGNKTFQEMLRRCDAVLFLRHRIRFFLPDGKQGGSPGCDSALLAFGQQNVTALRQSNIEGALIVKGHD